MQNTFLRDLTAGDINEQVIKVLRGLGNPEPPIDLNEVRDLLRLDRRYYSSAEDGMFREAISRFTVAGRQIWERPGLLVDAIKKFDLRALYLPDRKRILIDSNLPVVKQRWSEAHEVGHSIIPWHDDAMFGDNKATLTPACHAQVETEANFAAGQLLFPHYHFSSDIAQLQPTIANIKALHRRYGNTITTTLWRFVEQSNINVVGAVHCHPNRPEEDFDPNSPLRYFVRSKSFATQFSNIVEDHVYQLVKGYCSWASRGPLGDSELELLDVNGSTHVFQFETFHNSYDALTIGVYVRKKSPLITTGNWNALL